MVGKIHRKKQEIDTCGNERSKLSYVVGRTRNRYLRTFAYLPSCILFCTWNNARQKKKQIGRENSFLQCCCFCSKQGSLGCKLRIKIANKEMDGVFRGGKAFIIFSIYCIYSFCQCVLENWTTVTFVKCLWFCRQGKVATTRFSDRIFEKDVFIMSSNRKQNALSTHVHFLRNFTYYGINNLRGIIFV